VRLLLDTHIAIWLVNDDPRLSSKIKAIIDAVDDGVFVSAASIWEISIKHALQKHKQNNMPFSGSDALEAFQLTGLYLLNVTSAHAAGVDSLPLHHGDPFDRLLISQARHESSRLLSCDKMLAAYGDSVLIV
jgi:PIN domain nuclease of toxin-antitoxin system